jgi:DtxR family manganese transport transcriptional regulator
LKSSSSKPTKSPVSGFTRTRTDHQSELAEDYVELIDELIEEKGEARAVDIAHELGVSHVTVSKSIGRMIDVGLVQSEPYRSIFLTDAGRKLAQACRRRHRIVRTFLIDLGVSEQVASIDAEGIEHHVSKTTLEAMERFSGMGR